MAEQSRPDDPNAWPPGWDKRYPKDVYDSWKAELDEYFDTWVKAMAKTMKEVEKAEAKRATSAMNSDL
jgi:hypothetical protein